MRTFFGLVLLSMAVALFVAEWIALGDPSLGLDMPGAVASTYLSSPPWYVHAGWFAVAAALGWIAVRLLRPGILGRLVRGRGFTPSAQ